MPTKAVAYFRYSTKKQRETSIEIQRTAIARYCKTNNFTVVAEFIDRAMSGTTDERPCFREMIAKAKEQPSWDVILVYDYSRFSRNYEDADRYLTELKAYGVSVVSVTESYEDYIRDIFSRDNDYVQKVSGTTRAGLALKASKGEHCGGKPPYGYGIDATGCLTINPSEAQVVKMIFDLFIDYYTYEDIEAQLRRNGIKNRLGKDFSRRAFINILKQRKYIGEYSWGAKTSKDSSHTDNNYVILHNGCPAIIDEPTFNKAQEMILRRANGKALTSEKSRTPLIATGRIVCGHCGHILTVRQRTRKGITYCLYTCPNHRKHTCPTKEVRADDVNKFTALCITKVLLKKKTLLTLERVTDPSELKQYRRRFVQYLMDPKNPEVYTILDMLDVRVTVDNQDINFSIQEGSQQPHNNVGIT